MPSEGPCYVALGDSSSQDAGCGRPSFADRLAAHLGAAAYVNLARFGVRVGEVVEDQLPAALRARPDVATVGCGANDILRDEPTDWDAVAAGHDRLLRALQDGGARVVLITYPDFTPYLPVREATRRRATAELQRLNDGLRAAARRHGALLADCAACPGSGEREMFLRDGLHASEPAVSWLAAEAARLLRAEALAA